MPWHQRLSTQLVGLTTVVLLVALVAYAAVERGVRDVMLAQGVAGAVLFSETIGSATSRAMLEDQRQDAYGIMEAIGRQPGIDRVRMINKAGLVTYSTVRAEVGQVLDRQAGTCRTCHAHATPPSHPSLAARSQVVVERGHRAVELISPIYNDARCASGACHHHPRGAQVLGLIDVTVSLEDADRRLATFRTRGLGVAALGMLFTGGLLLVYARRRVILPVAALVEGTRRVARDELDLEIPVLTGGELGGLASSFNEMTRSLRRSEEDLRRLNQGLERTVAERTAELTRAHAALVQSEKLSSLGQLSASIAHEINNPLAGILTYAKLLAREAETDVPDEARRRSMVKRLSMVQREAERCSAIVRNLLDFARARPLQLKDVELDKVVRESLQLIGHQLALQGHTVETRLARLPPVHADFGELRQAFVNLALNAMEAMGKGGHLTVLTRALEDGRSVEIAITDDGPGIPPEIRSKIFDPFFTTKEMGTGLGLSVVYGIVQRHGGTVTVESEPGRGTTFTLRLPVSPAAAPPPPAGETPPAAPPPAGGA
ncbi:MAG: HAMP domain-containing protein [Anaeromyxobacter sp.]|nr:HAMP domain-containing protein [Anaeromyxobacter sp.]